MSKEPNDMHGDEHLPDFGRRFNRRQENPDAWKDLREDLHKQKRSQSTINQTPDQFRKKWQP